MEASYNLDSLCHDFVQSMSLTAIYSYVSGVITGIVVTQGTNVINYLQPEFQNRSNKFLYDLMVSFIFNYTVSVIIA